MAKTTKTATFEKSLTNLEKIVNKLEHEQLPLEDALKQFEAGIALTRECHSALEKAEKQVNVLIETNDKLTPFDKDDI